MLNKKIADKFLCSLQGLEAGRLELTTPDGRSYAFEGGRPGPDARLELRDWRALSSLAARGDIGFTEGYRAGRWDTDNLQNLIALALQNDRVVGRYLFGGFLSQMGSRLLYLTRLNSLRGSKKNIHAHYDLGNDFYSLWLDPGMTYSSALFRHPGEDIVDAQNNKYDRIIDRMDMTSGRVLEIGCGWGGFAERALGRGDYDMRGITLSNEQHDYARHRLGGTADIVLEDYRHQSGQYDRIVSIEMFEAVGEKYWPSYFSQIGRLLRPGGKAVVQTITIEDNRFARYRRGGDVIRSYIFPGGMLPSPQAFGQSAAAAGLRETNRFFFGQDYARTLEIWLQNFDRRIDDVKALGFDDAFIRLWRLYLAGCIAGFRTGRIDVMQTELSHA